MRARASDTHAKTAEGGGHFCMSCITITVGDPLDWLLHRIHPPLIWLAAMPWPSTYVPTPTTLVWGGWPPRSWSGSLLFSCSLNGISQYDWAVGHSPVPCAVLCGVSETHRKYPEVQSSGNGVGEACPYREPPSVRLCWPFRGIFRDISLLFIVRTTGSSDTPQQVTSDRMIGWYCQV